MKKILIIITLFILFLFIKPNINASTNKIIDDGNLLNAVEESNLNQNISKLEGSLKKYEFYVLTFSDKTTVSSLLSASSSFYYNLNADSNSNFIFVLANINGVIGQNHLYLDVFGNEASDVISNSEATSLVDKVFDDFKKANYYQAFNELLNISQKEIKSSQTFSKILPHLILLGIALVIATLIALIFIFKLNPRSSINERTYASNYNIVGRKDQFVRRTVVRVPISNNNNSIGGRSSGGRSSGGRSF